MSLFANECAFITGAASGIGRAIAEALLNEGAQLVLTDLHAHEALVASTPNTLFIGADLRNEKDVLKLFSAAETAGRHISMFIHAASPKRDESQTVLDVTEDCWRETMDVDLRAGFVLARAVAVHMRENSIRGRIIFITSLHSETPRNLPHYSAAKAGATITVKELARAFGKHGIRINAIAPGVIHEDETYDRARIADIIPLQRSGRPKDIASVAVALLSDKYFSYVTGTTVVVDGGLSLFNWLPFPSEQR